MKNKTKKVVGGIFLVFATLFMLSGVVVTVFHPAILPEQKPEKNIPLAFSAKKQAEKEEILELEKKLKSSIELLEALNKEMPEEDRDFDQSTRECLEEIISNLRARIDSARDSPSFFFRSDYAKLNLCKKVPKSKSY